MLDTLIDRLRAAHENNTPLIIEGGGSKSFYGNADEGEVLSTRKLTGVIDYQPKELVLTARAGTPLAEIEALLDAQNQMLAEQQAANQAAQQAALERLNAQTEAAAKAQADAAARMAETAARQQEQSAASQQAAADAAGEAERVGTARRRGRASTVLTDPGNPTAALGGTIARPAARALLGG
jgi:FAD/FMN-containing dehydrogenase